MATTIKPILHLGMATYWRSLYADMSKSPVKYAGNGFSHVAHLNAVSMETAYFSRWFYS